MILCIMVLACLSVFANDLPLLGIEIGDTKEEAFYPAFLRYGVKGKGGWRINPRKNYIEDSFELHRQEMVGGVAQALGESLKGIFDK